MTSQVAAIFVVFKFSDLIQISIVVLQNDEKKTFGDWNQQNIYNPL